MRAVRILAVVYFVFTAIGLLLWRASARTSPPIVEYAVPATPVDAPSAQLWFNDMRPNCTAEEVESRLELNPAPATDEGNGYTAVCWAIAGRTTEARALLDRLPTSFQRWAAGVVFGATHPAVDSGREAELAPVMELVVEYQPNNVMALYHAGSAAYGNGRSEAARDYLGRFLSAYGPEDGWADNARTMLEALQ
ncbi:MAG: hypothetical protein HKN64_05215 [Woeseiaceae bacterium]|nr:hypothetical protein [Woeseiaceae bacterium]